MSVSTTTTFTTFTGNNSTSTAYQFSFRITGSGDLAITTIDSAGVASDLTSSQYSLTLTNGGLDGGSFTTTTAVPVTSTITVSRATPYTQLTRWEELDKFPASATEGAYDRICLQLQQLDAAAGRSIRLNPGETIAELTPSARRNTLPYFSDTVAAPYAGLTPAQLLTILNLEIPTSVVDRPTTTFANAAARAAATPDFTAQVGIQLDTLSSDPLGSIYTAGSTSAGDWDLVTVSEDSFATALGLQFDRHRRSQLKSLPVRQGVAGTIGIDGAVPGMPTAGDWTSDDVTGAPAASNPDDHHGFPHAVWIPGKRRLLISYRVANSHSVGDAAMWIGYTDDYGKDWTHTELYDVANTDYRSLGLCLLQDDRIMGVLSRVDNATSGTKDYNIFIIYSSDFGETWTSPELLVNNTSKKCQTSSKPIQLRDGTILIPYYYATTATFSTSSTTRVYYSTDAGATWSGNVTVSAAAHMTEMNIVQRHDNDTLVGIIRNNAGTIHRTTSSDSGATWAALSDISAQVGDWDIGLPVLHLDTNNRLWMMSKITNGGSGLWYSDDYGATWSDPAAGNWGSVASYGNEIDIDRSDILSNHNLWAEGNIIPLSENILVAVMGGEASGGQASGSIYLRTWVVGGGTAGSSGGLHLRGGGHINFDSVSLPRMFDADRDALTVTAGDAVYSKSAKCIEVYNGQFWDAQGSNALPLNPALTKELDLSVEAEPHGALASSLWVDDAGILGDWTTTNSPAITADEMRGRAALVFNGTNQDASDTTGGTQWDFLVDDSADYTLIIPFKPHADNAGTISTIFSTLNNLASSETGLGIWIDDRSAQGDRCLYAGMPVGSGWAKRVAQRSVISPSVSTDPKVTAQRIIEWGNWHTLAVTYLSDPTNPVAPTVATGEFRLYLDGVLVGSDTAGQANRTTKTLSRLPHIGSNDSESNPGTGYWFKGSFGRVLLYKDVLTAGEVMQASTALIR